MKHYRENSDPSIPWYRNIFSLPPLRWNPPRVIVRGGHIGGAPVQRERNAHVPPRGNANRGGAPQRGDGNRVDVAPQGRAPAPQRRVGVDEGHQGGAPQHREDVQPRQEAPPRRAPLGGGHGNGRPGDR